MSANFVAALRAHLAELDGCPTIVLHPDDYQAHLTALCAICGERAVAFVRDETVPRGCWRVKH